MYLLAIKSLARFILPKKIYALDDGSLTEADKEILHEHLNSLEITPIGSVKNQMCPKGGCWERILLISDLVNSQYIMQVDSDTLTLGKPNEVINCIQESRSYTLGTTLGPKIVSMEEMAIAAKRFEKDGDTHVQVIAESSFDKFPNYTSHRYVRGNAGFTGFAKNSFTRREVEELSVKMAECVGKQRWQEWGSEQVTSNVIIANSPIAEVLPLDKYYYYHPNLKETLLPDFLHFIGT